MSCRRLCIKLQVEWNFKKKTKFKNIFIQPNAGDGGGSLGATVCCSKLKDYENLKKNNNKVYLGPSFSNSEIPNVIKHRKDLKNFSII